MLSQRGVRALEYIYRDGLQSKKKKYKIYIDTNVVRAGENKLGGKLAREIDR